MNFKKTPELIEAERELKEKLAQRRNKLFRLDDGIPVLKDTVSQSVKVAVDLPVETPIQEITIHPKAIPNIKMEIKELEKEIDELTKKPVDLSKKYWVTQTVVDNSAAFIDTAKEQDFQKIEFINELEDGWVLNVWLEEFKYFKILRVVKSDTWKSICVVSFKLKTGEKRTASYIIMFPVIENWILYIYSTQTQEQIWKFKVISAKLNKKTILEKIDETKEKFSNFLWLKK